MTTNKLIITWKDYSPQACKTERESFKCNDEKAAIRLLNRRNLNTVYFATFFNNKGEKKVFNIDSKGNLIN